MCKIFRQYYEKNTMVTYNIPCNIPWHNEPSRPLSLLCFILVYLCVFFCYLFISEITQGKNNDR